MRSNYKNIGAYIRKVDNRNTDLKVTKLLGLSMTKEFRETTSNIVGTDMSVYKIVNRWQFTCDFMSPIRVNKLPVVLKTDDEPIIVSPAYPVFEVIDKSQLNPEYLMMWFRRSEFDRYATFKCDSAIRGGYDWEELCKTEIPVPHINKQNEIVKEYNTIVNHINLNNHLIKKLEETAQAIYKQWFVDFEFPDENGNAYKSNGGEMELNEELEMEIPKGWEMGQLKDISIYSKKRISVNDLSLDNYISTENMLVNRGGISIANTFPSANTVTKFEIGEILISNIRPYFKKIWFSEFIGGCSNDVLCFVPLKDIPSLFLYYILEKDIFFEYVMAGSKGTKMPRGDKKWILNYSVVIPNNLTLKNFTKITNKIFIMTIRLKRENKILQSTSELLLSKLATIEN